MKKRKKKLKVKWKNLIIFIIINILIIVLLTLIISTIINKISNINKESPIKEENKISKKEKKYKELNYINKKIDYYIDEYTDQYIKYKNENKDLPIEKVILYVNIGLNNDYYTNMKEAKNKDTEYILVNKYNYLTEEYIPNSLENINTNYSLKNMKLVNYAKNAFEEMAKDAKKENLNIIVMSSYRSYQYQVNLYNKYKKTDGEEAADTYSGRPGNSEHQTGLAIDIYNGKENYTNFEKTKEFTWMQENAYKYGFILRFPEDKTKETGYEYESWHYRYVGKEIAKYIYENNLCLEEYYAMKILPKEKGSLSNSGG